MALRPIPKEETEKLARWILQIVICQREIENQMDAIIKEQLIKKEQWGIANTLLNSTSFMNKYKIISVIGNSYSIKIAKKPFEECNKIRNDFFHKPYYYDASRKEVVLFSEEKKSDINYDKAISRAQDELDKISAKLGLTTFKEIFNNA